MFEGGHCSCIHRIHYISDRWLPLRFVTPLKPHSCRSSLGHRSHLTVELTVFYRFGVAVGGRWQYPTADVVASFRSLGAPTSTLTRRGWGVYSGNTRASLEAALTKLNPADAPAIRREAAKTVTTRLNKGAMEAAAKLKDAEAAAATATRNVTHATTLLGLSAPTAAPVSTLGTAMQPAGVAEAAASAIEVAESSDDEVGGWPSPPLSEAKRGKGKAKRGFTELDEEDEWIPNGEEKRGRF